MPTRNTRTEPDNSILPAQSKKLRMSYDEQLNLARKNFDKSRKRVESLKRTNKRLSYDDQLSVAKSRFGGPNKRNENSMRFKCCRSTEKPLESGWITSGKNGSRDAVLVFRTNILQPRIRRRLSVKAAGASKIKDVENRYDGKGGKTNSNSAKCNANLSQPSTSRNSTTPSKFGLDPTKLTKNKPLPLITPDRRQTWQKPRKQLSFPGEQAKTKKHLFNSYSSSDNSISSEGDDLQDSYEAEKFNQKMSRNDALHEVLEDAAGSSESFDDQRSFDSEYELLENMSDEDFVDYPYSNNMPALRLQLKYKFLQTETKLLRKIFVRHGLTEVQGDEHFSILWTGIHVKPDILRNLAPYQRVNHFPRSYELTRKDRLYKNIERMQHLRGLRHFDIVPQSFVLPAEYRDLVSAHNKHRGPWIVKPAASSRGRGIFIVNAPDQIPQDEQVLVSKYVADPLCIDGHKCDLRVYVLVTSFDPLIIYIFEEGLVRLATVKYDRNADNLWNPCMHLCNYSINKYHTDYIKSRDAHDEDVGHKWTLSALLRHLKSQGCDTRLLMANIEDLIIKSILCCAQSIIAACRMFVPSGNNCFELYGFDILIDDTLKPWLLEVNLSPSLGVDSPLDSKVKACLITDLMTCIGIPAYGPTMRAHYDSKWTRFRNVSVSRRTTSAEAVNNTGPRKGNSSPITPQLTMEEQRIVRTTRLQDERRGGFVRIFPTEDTIQRYGTFLDGATGIPMSTPLAQGQITYSMILPHNYNLMLHSNLYAKAELESRGLKTVNINSMSSRMAQYERALPVGKLMLFNSKREISKSLEEGRRLRKQILKMIDNGSELTQLQARQAFALYLDSILRRLTTEPRDYHEKLILKFLNRVGGAVKAPVCFRSTQNIGGISKARSAMVAKLLGDFLEQYNRDTEAYVDSFDHFGMIPTTLYSEFLSQAQEADLESVLALNTNLSGTMPYLYNRCGLSVPPTPPIPSGLHGFLRALPAMVLSGAGSRDFNKSDGYYRNIGDKELPTTGPKNDKLPDVAINKKIFTRR